MYNNKLISILTAAAVIFTSVDISPAFSENLAAPLISNPSAHEDRARDEKQEWAAVSAARKLMMWKDEPDALPRVNAILARGYESEIRRLRGNPVLKKLFEEYGPIKFTDCIWEPSVNFGLTAIFTFTNRPDTFRKITYRGADDYVIEKAIGRKVISKPENLPFLFCETGNSVIDAALKNKIPIPRAVEFFRAGVKEAQDSAERYGSYTKDLILLSGQALNILSWIRSDLNNASRFRLTTDSRFMVQSPDKERGPSYLRLEGKFLPQSQEEGKPGVYYRGVEGIEKLGDNILKKAIYDQVRFDSLKDKTIMYLMVHGFLPVPEAMLAATESGNISTIHETSFLTDLIPGSRQCTSTGPGHFQAENLDIKYVTEGYGIQYNKIYDGEGKLIKVLAQYLRPGVWALALPGAVDSVENLGGLRFNDFSVKLTQYGRLLSKFTPYFDFSRIQQAEARIKETSKRSPYISIRIDGDTKLEKFDPDAPEIIWVAPILSSQIFGKPSSCLDLYKNLTDERLSRILDSLAGVLQQRASASGIPQAPLARKKKPQAAHNPYKDVTALIADVGHRMGLNEDTIARVRNIEEERIDLKIPVPMDDGSIIEFSLYVCRHNTSLGPAKGGISIEREEFVYPDEIRAKSVWMSVKDAIAGFRKRDIFPRGIEPFGLGGGKSGIVIPEGISINGAREGEHEMSDAEVEKLARGYVRVLNRHGLIGPKTYIPAPDIGLDARWAGRFMQWIADEYRIVTGRSQPEVVTGKPVTGDAADGIVEREGATELGGLYILQELMPYLGDLNKRFKALESFSAELKGKTAAVQGAGKVGTIARLLHNEGIRVEAWSDRYGALYSEAGLDIPKLSDYRAYGVFERNDENFPRLEEMTNEDMLELGVDMLVLAATDNVITKENASKINAKVILCLANGPVTPDAEKILTEKGILVVPDVLANIGGVTVSFFEMLQNISNRPWTADETREKLRRVMRESLEDVLDIAKREDASLTIAAYMLALKRITEGAGTKDAPRASASGKDVRQEALLTIKLASDSGDRLRQRLEEREFEGAAHLIFVLSAISMEQLSKTAGHIQEWRDYFAQTEKYTVNIVEDIEKAVGLLNKNPGWNKTNTIIGVDESSRDIIVSVLTASGLQDKTKILSVVKSEANDFIFFKTYLDMMAALARINKPLDEVEDEETLYDLRDLFDKLGIRDPETVDTFLQKLTDADIFKKGVLFIIKLPPIKPVSVQQLKELYDATVPAEISA